MITARLHIDIVNNVEEKLPFEVTPHYEAQGQKDDGSPFRTGAHYQWCYDTRKWAEEIRKRIYTEVRQRTGTRKFTWQFKTEAEFRAFEDQLNSIVNDMRTIAA